MDYDDFPYQLEQLRREHYRKQPWLPMPYDPTLIGRIVAYVLHRRLYQETVAQCSEKLGFPPASCEGGSLSDATILPSSPTLRWAACRRWPRCCQSRSGPSRCGSATESPSGAMPPARPPALRSAT